MRVITIIDGVGASRKMRERLRAAEMPASAQRPCGRDGSALRARPSTRHLPHSSNDGERADAAAEAGRATGGDSILALGALQRGALLGEEAERLLPQFVRDTKGRGNRTAGPSEKRRLVGGGRSGDDVGSGTQPEPEVEFGLRVESAMKKDLDAFCGAVNVSEDLAVSGNQRREGDVAELEAGTNQGIEDGELLGLVRGIANDTKKVARAGAGGKGVRLALTVENGQSIDNGIEWVASDGVLCVAAGVGKAMAFEVPSEEFASIGVVPGIASVESTLLLAM